MNLTPLLVFLGTNFRLASVLHLYEAAGFRRITRDELPVADYYARADILMENHWIENAGR
ncbi:MAG: hypothetical protein ACREPY_16435 [Rhodanobacteraceae bacterium]